MSPLRWRRPIRRRRLSSARRGRRPTRSWLRLERRRMMAPRMAPLPTVRRSTRPPPLSNPLQRVSPLRWRRSIRPRRLSGARRGRPPSRFWLRLERRRMMAPRTAPLPTVRRSTRPPSLHCCDPWAVSAASPGAESPSSETSRTGGEGAKNADLIDVWRLEKSAHSRRGAGRKTQFNRSGPPSGESLGIGTQGPPGEVGVKPLLASKRARNKNRHSAPSSTLASADARKAATPPPPRAIPRMTSLPTKNIAKRQSIVICLDLVQRQGSSRGRKSTRTPRSPSFLSSDRCLWNKPTSAPKRRHHR